MTGVARHLSIAIALSIGPGVLRAQPTTFRLLGAGSWVRAVSADGSTVVGYAGYWTASAGWIGLPNLPGGSGWVYPPWPMATTSDGSVFGGAVASNDGWVAARWTATGLAVQGYPNGYGLQSRITGVSADGETAVGEAEGGTPIFCDPWYTSLVTAFRQDHPGGPIHKLSPLAGLNSSAAVGVSADGSAVVGISFDRVCFNQTANVRACRWTSGQAQALGFLPGGLWSEATAASADGSVIVGTSGVGASARAFRWTQGGGMVNLGVLPGFAGSGAAAVSADGSVIVGSSWPEQGDAAAFIWDSASGMRELRAVLGERGVLVPASALEGAVGISADGRTIVGNGHWENPVGSPNMGWIAFLGEAVCYPDCNVDGTLTVADFGCFQTKFVAGDPYADCNADGGLTVADFGCFQTSFVTGCP